VFNPLGSAIAPATSLSVQIDSNYFVDFDFTYKYSDFCQIKKNKHDANFAFSLSVKFILKRFQKGTVTNSYSFSHQPLQF